MDKAKYKHIVWYADLEKLNFNDPWVKKWWIEQVLTYGRGEEVGELNYSEIKGLLSKMHLPKTIKSLWEDYFKSGNN